MTTVENPSLWYRHFVGYKNGNGDHHTDFSALTAAYLEVHQPQLTALLGGEPTAIVVVPSTHGKTFEKLPLANVVRRSARFKELLVDGVSHVPGQVPGRQQYMPEAFKADPKLLSNQRVIVIEDLWVSGSKAVSTGGAVLQAGAKSVLILPIGREVRPSGPYCPQAYIDAMKRPYSVDDWPRGAL